MHCNHAICLRVFQIEHKSIGKLILSLNGNIWWASGWLFVCVCNVQARAIHASNTILVVSEAALPFFDFIFFIVVLATVVVFATAAIRLAEVEILHFFSFSFPVKQNTDTWKWLLHGNGKLEHSSPFDSCVALAKSSVIE